MSLRGIHFGVFECFVELGFTNFWRSSGKVPGREKHFLDGRQAFFCGFQQPNEFGCIVVNKDGQWDRQV